MYCKYCGSPIPDGANFCPSCGRSTDAASAQNSTRQHTQTDAEQSWQSDNGQKPASDSGAMNRLLAIIGPQPYFTIGSYLVWGGCFISFISLFLCFCTVTLYSTHLITIMDLNHSGWVIALLAVTAILNLLRLYVGDLVGTGILAFMIWHYAANIDELLGVFSYAGLFGAEAAADGIIVFGIGLYVMIFGILLMLAGSVWGLVVTILESREAAS